MNSYSGWLSEQTPDRREASLAIMQVCIKLGEEQRKAPYSEECKQLTAQVEEYYRKWETK
jgi:hypothetical protein